MLQNDRVMGNFFKLAHSEEISKELSVFTPRGQSSPGA
jgi:hypothetical protein